MLFVRTLILVPTAVLRVLASSFLILWQMLKTQSSNSTAQSSMEDILTSVKTGSLVLPLVNNSVVEDTEEEEEEEGLAAVDTEVDMVGEDTEEVEVEVDLEAGLEGHEEDMEVEDTAVEVMAVEDMVEEEEDIVAGEVEADTLMEDMGEEILTHLRHRMTSPIMPWLVVTYLQSFLSRTYYPTNRSLANSSCHGRPAIRISWNFSRQLGRSTVLK
jgi:hypothetical protein